MLAMRDITNRGCCLHQFGSVASVALAVRPTADTSGTNKMVVNNFFICLLQEARPYRVLSFFASFAATRAFTIFLRSAAGSGLSKGN
jgi:hypothetical protein